MLKLTTFTEYDKELMLEKIYLNIQINDKTFLILSKKTAEVEELVKSIQKIFKEGEKHV